MLNRVNIVVDCESEFFFVRREEVEQNVFEVGNYAALSEIGLFFWIATLTRQCFYVLFIRCRVDFLVSNRALLHRSFLPAMVGDTKLKSDFVAIKVEEAHEAIEQFRIGDFIVVDCCYIMLYIQNLWMDEKTIKGSNFLECT